MNFMDSISKNLIDKTETEIVLRSSRFAIVEFIDNNERYCFEQWMNRHGEDLFRKYQEEA